MTSEHIIYATASVAVLWALWPFFSGSDDKAAGVALGQLSHAEDSHQHTPPPPSPMPDLIACACDTCGRIRTPEQRWLSPALVPLPPGCRISHGKCPACLDKALAELDRDFPAAGLGEPNRPKAATA